MEFKELDLKPKGNFLQRNLRTPHVRKTIIAMLLGAVGAFLFFYFTEGQRMASIPAFEVFKSLGIGAFFGFFLTNSPCARGRC